LARKKGDTEKRGYVGSLRHRDYLPVFARGFPNVMAKFLEARRKFDTGFKVSALLGVIV
jgi:hypothetical protein